LFGAPLVTAITAPGRAKRYAVIDFRGEGLMAAALRQTSSFLLHLARRFYEARQDKAQQIVEQHRRFYRPETLQ
jgi:hypothetical protein